MIRDGEVLRRTTTGPLTVPSADVEIDFDIEWDVDDHVYLWGARVRRSGTEPRTTPSSRGSARRVDGERIWPSVRLPGCGRSSRPQTNSARALAVFHYSTPEPSYLKKVLGEETRG